MKALAAAALLVLLAGCGSAQGSTAADPLLVAAAADLLPAFRELGERYTEQTGRPVTFTFGSSGQLAQQLANGAPYELFASADVRYVDQVLAAGRGEASTKAEYALGRLAVWSRDAPVALDQLAEPRFGRIALANPEHAPYGRAAEQALRSAGALDPDRLVFGENVTDTLRLATSGNADVAVVALSVARTAGGHVTPVPAAAHEPLRQALVVTGRPDAAAPFAELVTSHEGRAVLARHGFAPPQGS
ncbi:MAG: molybdate ABC transporter substrate-binding protein [Mycobacteriales bacterium]